MNFENVENFKKEIFFLQKQLENSELAYFDLTQTNNLSISENFRIIVDHNFSNETLKKYLISHLEQINKFSPCVASLVPYLMSDPNISSYKIPKEEYISKNIFEPSTELVNDTIDFFFRNSSLLTADDFKTIFKHNGFSSSFDIKKSNSLNNACIFNSGYQVISRVPSIFFTALKKEKMVLPSAELVLYDGFIESVSEINLILNDSVHEKNSYVIFCRGAHLDVERTCAVNLGLEKSKVILCYPEESFWYDENIKNINRKIKSELYGYRNGRLLNNFEFSLGSKSEFLINESCVEIKNKNLSINKGATTTIYLKDSSWESRGIIADQLNFFKSLMEQISLCGFVSKDFAVEIGINPNLSLIKDLKFLPAFPIIRSSYEASKIFRKISSIGFIIR